MHTEIRHFSEEEKELVRFFIQQAECDKLDEFQVGRLLFGKLRCRGIQCDNSTKEVVIYPNGKANAHRSYSIIMSFCGFLKELESHGYIGIDSIIEKTEIKEDAKKKYFWIYNHTTHSVNQDILLKNVDGCPLEENNQERERFHSEALYSALKDIVYNKVVFVKPALKELEENDFLSIEAKRHRKNVGLQWVAIVCAIVFPFLNTLYTSLSGTKIHSEDLRNIDYKLEKLWNEQKNTNDRLSSIDSLLMFQNKQTSNDSVAIETSKNK